MNANTDSIAIVIPDSVRSAGFITTATANGGQLHTTKRLSRKEFAEAVGMKTNDKSFNVTFLQYVKGYDVQDALAIAAMRQKGLVFSGASIREDKKGNVTSGSIRFGTMPKDRDSKESKLAAAEKENEALKAKLASIEKMLEESIAAKKAAQAE